MVPYRGVDEEWRHLKLMGDLGQIVPVRYDVRDEDSVKAAIANSNVIVNCIGREYETRNFSYDDVNYHNSNRISKLAKEHGGIIKYIQMSCLGASNDSPSSLLRSKAAGEEATLQNFPEATILRSAPMVGTEDRLLNRWAIQAKKLPFVPIPGDGLNKIQPVLVLDVAAAVIAAIKDEGFSMGKTFELGGPDVFTMNELVELMFEAIREHPRMIHIPMFAAKLASLPREIALKNGIPIPFPTTYLKDYLDQLAVDSIVSPDAMGLVDLGITAHKIGGVTIEHLNAYRTGGPSVGTTVGESVHGAGF
jgi:NADH dehydrogenase (ubiquinone) 1 alpha subcomplex subunit 9